MRLNAGDLREFVRILEERGDLSKVGTEVDPEQEVAAVVNRVSKGRGGGKALIFEKIKESEWPVAVNLFGSLRRTAWALGVEDIQDLDNHLREALAKAGPGTAEERLRRLMAEREVLSIPGYSAPCREVVENAPDLLRLPALKTWPGDGGRFLTLPLIFTRHPKTGAVNCGMYRMQIFDSRTAGLHWRPASGGGLHYSAWSERGEKMPVAVALGGDTALIYAAGAPLPEGVDETAFAGFLRDRPVEMTPSLEGLNVPASAEFILEGYAEPGETRTEGPFGNHTGYYVPSGPVAVFHLTRMTRRKDPIFPATIVGPPPMEDCFLAKATERLFLPLLQIDFPEVADLNFPLEGIFHGCALIALRQEDSGRSGKLLRDLRQTDLLKASRLLVLLDADVDIRNYSESFWKSINHVDPRRDIIVEDGGLSIDATRKFSWPNVMEDPAVGRKVEARWAEYGLKD